MFSNFLQFVLQFLRFCFFILYLKQGPSPTTTVLRKFKQIEINSWKTLKKIRQNFRNVKITLKHSEKIKRDLKILNIWKTKSKFRKIFKLKHFLKILNKLWKKF